MTPVTRVALVGHDARELESLAWHLRSRGYEVDKFVHYADAASALDEAAPDLLITEIDFPGTSNGLELIARLRDRHGAHIPVIVVSSRCTESDFLRGFAAGANSYVRKPARPAELLALCSVHLERTNGEEAEILEDGPGKPYLHYSRGSRLGQGAYAEVFEAVDTKTSERVALKILKPTASKEASNRYRFLRESYALSAIDHPNVVRIQGFGLEGEGAYCAQQLVDGKSLDKAVLGRDLPSEEEIVCMLERLASALAALERHGVVHRDLKPANVLLRDGRYEEPVLLDFGLAKGQTDRSLTPSCVVLGTPGYMAPEYLLGKSCDTRSDMFALGLVACFTLTGHGVFPLLSGFKLAMRVAKGPIPVPECSTALRGVLERMLEIDPAKRYPSATDLQAALQLIQGRVSTERWPGPERHGVNRDASTETEVLPRAPESTPKGEIFQRDFLVEEEPPRKQMGRANPQTEVLPAPTPREPND